MTTKAFKKIFVFTIPTVPYPKKYNINHNKNTFYTFKDILNLEFIVLNK